MCKEAEDAALPSRGKGELIWSAVVQLSDNVDPDGVLAVAICNPDRMDRLGYGIAVVVGRLMDVMATAVYGKRNPDREILAFIRVAEGVEEGFSASWEAGIVGASDDRLSFGTEKGVPAKSVSVEDAWLDRTGKVRGPRYLRYLPYVELLTVRTGGATLDVVANRHELTNVFANLGLAHRRDDVIEAYEEQVAGLESTWGRVHRVTLVMRVNLLWARINRGDGPPALASLEEMVHDLTRVVGADDFTTLSVRFLVASERAKTDLGTAIAECEELLDDQRRVLGADHPVSRATLSILARHRGDAKDVEGAVKDYRELFAVQRRALGPDDAQTLQARDDLAYWLAKSGDHAAALVEYERLVADRSRIAGADHRTTLDARYFAAANLARAGDPAGAVEAFGSLVADSRRVLGPDHEDTLGARGALARWRGEAGDPRAAIADLTALLDDRIRVLGDDHPDVASTRERIDYWCGRLEALDEA